MLDRETSTPEQRALQQRVVTLWAAVDQLLNQPESKALAKSGVAQWHPGKIVMLWVGSMVLLAFLWTALGRYYRAHALFLWALASVPLLVATWRWLGARER